MIERAVYHSEDGFWYRHGDEPWRVTVVVKGEKIREKPHVVADTYAEAFLLLYGKPTPISPQVRAPRRTIFA